MMLIKRCSRPILLQAMIGLVTGVIYGVGIPDLAVQMKPLGDGLTKLIKTFIALIVFCVVVNGISGVGDLEKVGRTGLKPVTYLEISITITLVLGLVITYSPGLGNGANIHLNELPVSDVALCTGRTQEIHGPVAFPMDLIPTSVSSIFAENDILQVLLFSVLFGSALNLVGEQTNGVTRLINELSHIVFHTMGMIVRLAPLDVFGAVVSTTTRYSVDSLSHLGALVLVFYVTCLVFIMAVFGSILRLSGVRILLFLRYFREEPMIVMGAVPSDAVLPQVICKFEHMGIHSPTVGLVIPIGYSFNPDGFSIYLTLAAVFVAHVTGTPLAATDPIAILSVSLVISRGAHGTSGSALVILAVTLIAVPVTPVAGLVPMLPVGRFMGIGRAPTNLIGDYVVTVAIACWENDIDTPRVQVILDGCLEMPAKADDEPLKRSAVTGEGKLYD